MEKLNLANSFAITAKATNTQLFTRERVHGQYNALHRTGWVCLWLTMVGRLYDHENGHTLDWGVLMQKAAASGLTVLPAGDIMFGLVESSAAVQADLTDMQADFLQHVEWCVGVDREAISKEVRTSMDISPEGKLVHAANVMYDVAVIWEEVLQMGDARLGDKARECRSVVGDMVEYHRTDTEAGRWMRRMFVSALSILDEAVSVCRLCEKTTFGYPYKYPYETY